MENWNLPLALLDVVPVILFLAGYVNLLKAFYSRITPAQYTMLSAGGMMVFLAGFMKVIWKFLYVLEIGDYAILSDSFFPLQSAGFALLAMGIVFYSEKEKEPEKNLKSDYDYENLAVIPVLTSKVPFIILTVAGTLFFYGKLTLLGIKQKNKVNAMFFIAAYSFNMLQAILSLKFDNAMALMHWLAEMLNILAQVCMWLGAKRMRKEYEEERYGY